MEKRIKIRRDLKDFHLKKPVFTGAVFVLFFTSVLSYAFFFCVREVCAFFVEYGWYNFVIFELDALYYSFYNFFLAGISLISAMNATLIFISKTNDREYSMLARKAIRRSATNSTILFPSFLHTALELLFCFCVIFGWNFLFRDGFEYYIFSISMLTLVAFYFHSWNLFLKYYPNLFSKVIKGFFLFLSVSFLLSLWHPIKSYEIKEKILPTYTQYQMSIELPRSSVMKYARRLTNIGEIFIAKNGEYREKMLELDTSDNIRILPPRRKWGSNNYLTIVADTEVKMEKITPIKKSFEDEQIRRYYFATENPVFSPETKTYRKHFGQGRLFKIGLKNSIPRNLDYSTKEKTSDFLKKNSEYDFSDYFKDKTFIKLHKDSFFVDNEWFMKNEFTSKLKKADVWKQGFCIFIAGELNVGEFIHDMDLLSYVYTEDLFLTFDLQEYEFLKMQKSL